MKLFKKILAVTAVLTLTLSAIPVSAATDVLDFEDGKVPAGLILPLKDDGTLDGADATLTVVDFSGSKMLKLDPVADDNSVISKINFVLADLVGEENVAKVRTIEYDMIIENPFEASTNWNGGTVAAGSYGGGATWTNGTEWSAQDDTKNTSDVQHLTNTIADGNAFADSSAFFMFMNWGNNKAVNVYFDNVKFTDADGNAVAFAGAEAAVVEETDTTDTTDATPKTGTTSYAVYFLGGAAIMLAGAVVLKKRKSIEA